MGGVVAVGVVFEEGKLFGLEEDDDDDPSVLEVVVVVVVVAFFLPPSSFFLLLLLQLLLDFIVKIGRGLFMFLVFSTIVGWLFKQASKGASSKVSISEKMGKKRNNQINERQHIHSYQQW